MNSHPDWWSSFFQGVSLEFWRRAVPPEQSRGEADFIERALALAPSSRILDVPCGNGRIALELAARGHEVEGLDLATEYVLEARAAATRRALGARFTQGDMRRLAWEAEFDAAYCMGNSFAYFDDAGNLAFLQGVSKALRPQGRFVLMTGLVLESILAHDEGRAWYQLGDIFFLPDRKHDPRAGRLEVDYTFIQAGVVDRRHVSYRTYTLREVCALFEAAGLAVESTLGSMAGEPYETGSRCLYVTARRD